MSNRSSVAQRVQLASPTPASKPSGNWRIDFIADPMQLRSFAPDLEALRARSALQDSGASLPGWLEAHPPSRGWEHRILFLRCDDEPGKPIKAAIFLLERTLFGIATGYFHGSDAMGQTLILCDAGQENLLLSRAIELLLRSRAFLTLIDRPLTDKRIADPSKRGPIDLNSDLALAHHFSPTLRVRSAIDDVYWQHPLEPTFDASLLPFGHRTRRNLRYGLRRVERNGWNFLPNLTTPQLAAAIAELSIRSTHPYSLEAGNMLLRLSLNTPDGFAMGLTDKDGRWLSCLVGRRINGSAEVFWQSNVAGYGVDSFCTTMRSLFMRHEVSLRSSQVRYIGGTCPLMQHCCTPTQSLQLSIGRRGLRLRLLEAVLSWLPNDKNPRRRQFLS